MKRLVLVSLVLSSSLISCGPPPKVYWREMLGKAIYDFSDPMPENNASKVWIHNMDDKECDKGCQKGVEVVLAGGGAGAPALPALPALPGLGNMFGGGPWRREDQRS